MRTLSPIEISWEQRWEVLILYRFKEPSLKKRMLMSKGFNGKTLYVLILLLGTVSIYYSVLFLICLIYIMRFVPRSLFVWMDNARHLWLLELSQLIFHLQNLRWMNRCALGQFVLSWVLQMEEVNLTETFTLLTSLI